MNDLAFDPSIVHAKLRDFWPIQRVGQIASPAYLELSFGSGLLKLTHISMTDWVLVTPDFARIIAPGLTNMIRFQLGLGLGGALRNAFVELRCAGIIDRGIFSACQNVRDELELLLDHPSCRPVHQGNDEASGSQLTHFDR